MEFFRRFFVDVLLKLCLSISINILQNYKKSPFKLISQVDLELCYTKSAKLETLLFYLHFGLALSQQLIGST